jgi:hypothetical protein
LQKYTLSDLIDENIDISSLKINEEMLSQMSSFMMKDIDSIISEKINYLKNMKLTPGILFSDKAIRVLSPARMLNECFSMYLESPYAQQDLSIRLLLNEENLSITNNLLSNIANEIFHLVCSKLKKCISEGEDFPFATALTFFECTDKKNYLNGITRNPISIMHRMISEEPYILNIIGNKRTDILNNFVQMAFHSNFITVERKIEIFLSNLDCKYTDEEKVNLYSINLDEIFPHLKKEDVQEIFNKGKNFLSHKTKIKCFCALGASNHIDEMIEDRWFEVRKFCLSIMDPKDPRIARFAKDHSRTIFLEAVKKSHISFIPLFLSSRHIKDPHCKAMIDGRISRRF